MRLYKLNKMKASSLWCALGDFNVLRYACESKDRSNTNNNKMEMEKLNYFIEICLISRQWVEIHMI